MVHVLFEILPADLKGASLIPVKHHEGGWLFCRIGRLTRFFRTADAFRTPRREGPQRLLQKRPRTFVSPLASIAAVKTSNHRLSRDFWSLSIFDFFNIG